jgi:hypothetical protein
MSLSASLERSTSKVLNLLMMLNWPSLPDLERSPLVGFNPPNQNFSVSTTLIFVSHLGQVNLNGGTLSSGTPSLDSQEGQVIL